MEINWWRVFRGAAVLQIGCFLAVSSLHAQAAPAAKPQMADAVFKDVRLLKGIPVDQFLGTMGFFAASTGLNCTDCHGDASSESWAAYADDTKLKTTTRKMIVMVRAINEANFGGAPTVTCNTCHRGTTDPKPQPSLAQQYDSNPSPDDPNDFVIRGQNPDGPTPDQIFNKYLDALGGTLRVASLTSYVAKGSYMGWDTGHTTVPVEVFAKAPDLRATVVHTKTGDSIKAYDGSAGWITAPDNPLPLIAITGGDLYGAKVDAMLFFPAGISKVAAQWRVGSTNIGDADVQVVQGTAAGQLPVKLYFDSKSGLLLREVRVSMTAVGRNPTQIDFSDYREVAGVKMPFKWIVTWTDGQATIQLDTVEPNVAIEPAKFAKPTPSSAKK